MATIKEFINDFNNGLFEKTLKPVFNTVRNFLRVIKNKGLQSEIYISEIPDYAFWDDPSLFDYLEESGFTDGFTPNDMYKFNDDVQNLFLLTQLNKNPQKTLEYISKEILTDVEFKNDSFYLYLSSRSELIDLFNNDDKSLVRDLLNNDAPTMFDDTIWDNTYTQVIESLDDTNIEALKKYIIKHIGNVNLSIEDYDSDFFHSLSENQGKEGEFEITYDDVSDLIKDKTAMLELLNGDLSDLNSDLISVHHNAYNWAWNDYAEHEVWSALETYFDTEDWVYENKTSKAGGQVDFEYIRIRDFKGIISRFLTEYKMPEWRDWHLTYYDSYILFLRGLMENGDLEYLRLRVDYSPPYDSVDNYINELFLDYVSI